LVSLADVTSVLIGALLSRTNRARGGTVAQRFISIKEVVERICLSKTELYHRLKAGTFPKPVALGPKKVVFLESEVEAWMQARIEESDSSVAARRSRAVKAVESRRDRRVAP
jgi:prophage regulatory protein